MTRLPISLGLPLKRESWSEGLELPVEEIPVTATLIVTGAVASMDFYPGHHDRDAANEAGSPDIFMNIMTTAGLVSRYLTGLTGPDGRIDDLDLKLGAQNRPGDVMQLSGRVIEARAGARDALDLIIEFAGTNERGTHARGTAKIHIADSGAENAVGHEERDRRSGASAPRGDQRRALRENFHHEEETGEN